jgi:hypothetical protein
MKVMKNSKKQLNSLKKKNQNNKQKIPETKKKVMKIMIMKIMMIIEKCLSHFLFKLIYVTLEQIIY